MAAVDWPSVVPLVVVVPASVCLAAIAGVVGYRHLRRRNVDGD